MKGGTISNWQKYTMCGFFSSPPFIIFNYLAQDVKLILTLQSGLLSRHRFWLRTFHIQHPQRRVLHSFTVTRIVLCSTLILWFSKPVHLIKTYHCQQSRLGTWKKLCYATRHLEHPIPFTIHISAKMTGQYSLAVKFNDPSTNYVSKKKKLAQNYFNENYSQSSCQPCLKSLHRKITIEHYNYMYLRQQLTKIVFIKIIKNKSTFFWMLYKTIRFWNSIMFCTRLLVYEKNTTGGTPLQIT